MIDVIENYIHLEKRLPKNDSTKNDSFDYYPTFCGGACILLSLKTDEKTLEGNVWLTYCIVRSLCSTDYTFSIWYFQTWIILADSRLIFWEIILSQTESCQENKCWFVY